MNANGRATERRRRITRRAIPLVAVAFLAFVVGAVAGSSAGGPNAEAFLQAWQRGDIDAMYAELTPDARAQYSLKRFQNTYADTVRTATIESISVGEVSEQGDSVIAPVSFTTQAFGPLQGQLALPIVDGKVAWTPNLAYPGLAADERLSRRTRAPQRAPILAADRSPLARGPAAARVIGTDATAVVGEVGQPSGAQAKDLAARGFPPGSLTGTSGLELAFDNRLAGRPGGQLVAVSAAHENRLRGGRILASSQPVPGKAVRTTIDPTLQESAVSALGSLYGGVAVLDAKTGEVRALAGLGYSAPQPPGSTFKMITATAALDAGVVKTSDTFPVESSNSEIGREIPNAHDELCGGTFAESFAMSCNTVFAPLGARVGGPKLVATSELYGFNSPPALFDPRATAILDPPQSRIPPEMTDSVEVGESAIGQGRVLATPLEMATVAQTIANKGVRMPTPIAKDPALQPDLKPVKVTSPETAQTMRELMIGVVTGGTGVAAALPGVQVAGKTGTAELGPSALQPGQDASEAEQDIDAWFASFAPANDPKLVVAVMVVNASGDGGTVAAPVARQVLATGLGIE